MARKVIKTAMADSAGTALSPIPFADTVLLIPILSGMVSKILALYGLSLNENVVIHVIESIWPKIFGETAFFGWLGLFTPLVYLESAIAANARIADSLGKATIDLCTDYYLANGQRNFEDIFTGNFTGAVASRMKIKGGGKWAS